jgi:hypothetical protein
MVISLGNILLNMNQFFNVINFSVANLLAAVIIKIEHSIAMNDVCNSSKKISPYQS